MPAVIINKNYQTLLVYTSWFGSWVLPFLFLRVIFVITVVLSKTYTNSEPLSNQTICNKKKPRFLTPFHRTSIHSFSCSGIHEQREVSQFKQILTEFLLFLYSKSHQGRRGCGYYNGFNCLLHRSQWIPGSGREPYCLKGFGMAINSLAISEIKSPVTLLGTMYDVSN